MPSQMTFTIEDMRAAADLVKEFGSQDSTVVSQLILDLAIARKFDDTGDDAAFRENMRAAIRLRFARNKARVFGGASKAIH